MVCSFDDFDVPHKFSSNYAIFAPDFRAKILNCLLIGFRLSLCTIVLFLDIERTEQKREKEIFSSWTNAFILFQDLYFSTTQSPKVAGAGAAGAEVHASDADAGVWSHIVSIT